MIELTLPLPPTINHAYYHVNNAKHMKPEGKAFREFVCWEANRLRIKPIDGRVGVHITIHQKTKLNIDLDNRSKAALDALQAAGVFANDNQIDDLQIVRGEIDKSGRCEIRVWQIT